MVFEVPPTMTFTRWGELDKEDIEYISDWTYKDTQNLPPLPPLPF